MKKVFICLLSEVINDSHNIFSRIDLTSVSSIGKMKEAVMEPMA